MRDELAYRKQRLREAIDTVPTMKCVLCSYMGCNKCHGKPGYCHVLYEQTGPFFCTVECQCYYKSEQRAKEGVTLIGKRAIYNQDLYNIVGDKAISLLLSTDDGVKVEVPFHDQTLFIDPCLEDLELFGLVPVAKDKPPLAEVVSESD